MRRVSQQIGWSQESKLLYYVLKQLERLTAVLGKNIPTPPPPVVTSLKITWDDIANVPVANALSVSDWNTLFNLPTLGNPFTHVFIDPMNANTIVLANGSNITTVNSLFSGNGNILSVEDLGSLVVLGGTTFGSSSIQTFSSTSVTTLVGANFYQCGALTSAVIPLATSVGNDTFSGTALTSIDYPNLLTAGNYSFVNTAYVTSVNLPALTTIGPFALQSCGAIVTLSTINLSSCTDLGGTVGNDGVFNAITGQTITLTVPAALMTCNGGNPDGDIQDLQANNTVTIVTV